LNFSWSSISADERNLSDITERFNQSMDLGSRFFKVIYNKFGHDIRMSEILNACNKKGIAKAIEPNWDEINEIIAKEFGALRAINKLKFSDDRAAFDSILSTSMYIQGYKVGFNEAVKILKTQNFCEVSEVEADKLLLQKKQSNKKKEK
jgi:hypothetical protein